MYSQPPYSHSLDSCRTTVERGDTKLTWLEFNENQSEFTCVISANRLLMLEAFEGLSLPFISPSDEFSSKLQLSINALYDCWE